MSDKQMSLEEAKKIVRRGEPQEPSPTGHPEDARDAYRDWEEAMERYRAALALVSH